MDGRQSAAAVTGAASHCALHKSTITRTSACFPDITEEVRWRAAETEGHHELRNAASGDSRDFFFF